MRNDIDAVLRWWFGENAATTQAEVDEKLGRWFRDGAKNDAVIREKFGALVGQAVNGGLVEWEQSLEGRVALIILLDQFTRHAYRDLPRMYAGDARAQRLSLALCESGEARRMRIDWRHFSMMPMLHSEVLALQQRSVVEMDAIAAEAPEVMRGLFAMGTEQAHKYLGVVTRFGRFPHRNAILGRTSTAEEQTFIETFVGPPKGFEKKT